MLKIVKMKSDVSFGYRKKRFTFEYDNGYLVVKYGDDVFNANGEWKFQFPEIVNREYIWNGIRYLIPFRYIDMPFLINDRYRNLRYKPLK